MRKKSRAKYNFKRIIKLNMNNSCQRTINEKMMQDIEAAEEILLLLSVQT